VLQVTVMHNHCMSQQGMVEGFRFSMNPKENNQFMPMNRRMFFRHSMVECHSSPLPSHTCLYHNQHAAAAAAATAESEQVLTSCQEDHAILRLLLRQNEVKDKLVTIMQKIHAVSSSQKSPVFRNF
jgi:hypothetical protein